MSASPWYKRIRFLAGADQLNSLILQLEASDPPFPIADIDESGTDEAVKANLALFKIAASTAYRLAPSSLFSAEDLLQPDELSLSRIIHTLTAIEDRSAPAKSSLMNPLPLDINLRGRLVRARSTNAAPISLDGREESGSISSENSRTSSRMTDYSFAIPAQKSVETPSVSSGGSSGPNVTFIERIKASDREKEWAAPAGIVGCNKIYGNRSGSESAVDILTVVREDETGASKANGEQATRGFHQSNSPRRTQRYSSDVIPVLRLDGTSSPRPGPSHFVQTQRSRCSGVEDTTRPIGHLQMLESSSQTSSIAQIDLESRPKQHKRWNSEIIIEPSALRDLPEGSARSRHESFQSSTPPRLSNRTPVKIARTKLVLREEGHPTMTFQLGECIGRGQHGSVYRALNLNSGRVVAIKRIELDGKTEQEVQQLSNEIVLLQNLAHEAVVRYEGVINTEHHLNIILEYVENGSLQHTIKAYGELPEALVASYVVRILEGLDFLHSKNVVHCDLKGESPIIGTLERTDGKLTWCHQPQIY